MKKMSRKMLLLGIILSLGVCLFATEQIRDKFIGPDRKVYDIHGGYPLDGFFRENPDLSHRTDMVRTDLWRGYIAFFQLSNEVLYLTDIRYPKGIESVSLMDQVFPGEETVPALWFSGNLAFPLEEGVLELTIEKGEVLDRQIQNHAHDLLAAPSNSYLSQQMADLQPLLREFPTFRSFESITAIQNGSLQISHYSPDTNGFELTYPAMLLTGREPFYTIQSIEEKGILLFSEDFLFAAFGNHYHQACSSGTSSQCMEGIFDLPLEQMPYMGNQRSFYVEPVYIRELIFSSGVVSVDDPDLYYKYARPRNIRVTNISTSKVIEFELADTAHPQVVDLGEEGKFEISIEVLSIYEGNETQDIGINFIKAKGW